MHKEPGDKDGIRALLLTLSGDELGVLYYKDINLDYVYADNV